MVGIKFTPTGLWRMFHWNMEMLTNEVIPLQELLKVQALYIQEKLTLAPTNADKIGIVENFLLKLLTGVTWKIIDKKEFEVWKIKEGTATLTAKAFRVQGGDTLITEVISLTHRDHSFHYIPDVAGDQEPVDFQITSHDEKSFVAENPRHDFPKIIRYNWVRKNTTEYIEAAIEGATLYYTCLKR